MPRRKPKQPSTRLTLVTPHAQPPAVTSFDHVNTVIGRMRSANNAKDSFTAVLESIASRRGQCCGTCTLASTAAMILAYLAEQQGLSIDEIAETLTYLAQEISERRPVVARAPEVLQ